MCVSISQSIEHFPKLLFLSIFLNSNVCSYSPPMPQFEYFRQHDVIQLTSPSYSGDMIFSDNMDVLPPIRDITTPLPEECALHVRMWESPDSARRVWGEVSCRLDVLQRPPGLAGVLDIVKIVLREAACEAHVTLAKLTARIASRQQHTMRMGSARASLDS